MLDPRSFIRRASGLHVPRSMDFANPLGRFGVCGNCCGGCISPCHYHSGCVAGTSPCNILAAISGFVGNSSELNGEYIIPWANPSGQCQWITGFEVSLCGLSERGYIFSVFTQVNVSDQFIVFVSVYYGAYPFSPGYSWQYVEDDRPDGISCQFDELVLPPYAYSAGCEDNSGTTCTITALAT